MHVKSHIKILNISVYVIQLVYLNFVFYFTWREKVRNDNKRSITSTYVRNVFSDNLISTDICRNV